jgi:TolA-binding protein
VKDPLGDEFVTDLCERPLEIEVKDDHGVARIALEYRILSQTAGKTKDWTGVEFNREQNSRDYGELMIKCEYVLNIGQMGLQPGDHVELRFRAEDFKDVGGRNMRLSKVYKMSIVSVGTLEKELQDAIEKIKILLKNQKLRQDTAWSRTGRLITNYGRLDQLSPEQQSEVRQAGLEQNDITSKLDGARKDIRQIQRRGVYNKIYNEAAASKLQGALDELDPLVGVPGEAARDGLSRVAAAKIDGAARLKSGAERSGSFREGQNLQSAVSTGIQKALDFLDKWSSYQEVIRIARELKEAQEQNNKDIKKTGGGK